MSILCLLVRLCVHGLIRCLNHLRFVMFPHGHGQIDNFGLLAVRCRLYFPAAIRILQSDRLKIAGSAVFNLIWLGFAAGFHDNFAGPLHFLTGDDLPAHIVILLLSNIVLIWGACVRFALKRGDFFVIVVQILRHDELSCGHRGGLVCHNSAITPRIVVQDSYMACRCE